MMRRIFCMRHVIGNVRTAIIALCAVLVIGHIFYDDGSFGVAVAHADVLGAIKSGAAWLIYYIARFFGLIGIAGATLFAYVLDANVLQQILGSPVITVIWTMVRDVLNLSFILILLFSAFATIFQVDRYHVRNVIVRLVIMALLVNFSLPIAKVIIDASNIIMYFFVNQLFPTTVTGFEIPQIFGKATNIVDVFVPIGALNDPTIGYMLTAALFAFFYMISMMTIAGILVVRLIVLAILMIFSPIGFVAMILPQTQGYAQKWWSNLFKYAFNGPILVFMLFFATTFMAYTHDMAFNRDSENKIAIKTNDATLNADQTSYVSNMVFLMIPVVILWSGIIMMNTASDGASQMIVGFGQNISRRAGRRLRYFAVGGAAIGARELGRAADMATGRIFTGGYRNLRNRYDARSESLRKKREEARNRVADNLYLSKEKRRSAEAKRFAKATVEAEKELRDLGLSASQLRDEMKNGATKERRLAAARLAAQKGAITSVEHMSHAMAAVSAAPTEGMREDLGGEIQRSVRNGGRRDIIAQYRIGEAQRSGGLSGDKLKETKEKIIKEEYRVGAEDLGKEKTFEALDNESKKLLKEHVDANIIVNAHAARDAMRGGNTDALTEISDTISSGAKDGVSESVRDRIQRVKRENRL